MRASRKILLWISVLSIALLLRLFWVTYQNTERGNSWQLNEDWVSSENLVSRHWKRQNVIKWDLTTMPYQKMNELIQIVIVSCGDRKNATLTLIKSAITLSTHPLRFYVFTEKSNVRTFEENKAVWPKEIQDRVDLVVLPAEYPKNIDGSKWISLFKRCASLRLFLPDILLDVDSVLYLDTDIVFVAPVERIWNAFHKMNGLQMSAMVPESEDAATGWYNRFAKHPYADELGVNSGVMLMNLTRMRKFSWVEYLDPILQEFRRNLVWGDQDIINIIFHYHMDKLYVLDCSDNYRPDHCMYLNSCKAAAKNGINIVHASRSAFHRSKFPVFKAIYNSWDEFDLGGDIRNLRKTLHLKMSLIRNETRCGKSTDLFLKYLSTV